MIDTRLEKFANILVNHSLEIKENDLFAICGSPVAAPLIREVYKQALKLGAHQEDRAQKQFRHDFTIMENFYMCE